MNPNAFATGLSHGLETLFSPVGGVMVVIAAMAGWLGKIWAGRILEREKAALNTSIETVKADLALSVETNKAELAKLHEAHKADLLEISSLRQNAMNRKRDEYAKLATKMRVILKAETSVERQEEDKVALLEAYAGCYLWGAEPVVIAVRDFFALLETKGSIDAGPASDANQFASQILNQQAQAQYQRIMLAMRTDCGFEDSTEYRIVTFG